MKTKLEKIESRIAQFQAKAGHIQRLIDGLDGRPADFEWTGEIGDAGKGMAHCVCGHEIRYMFPVYDTKKKIKGNKILGSVCIGNYAFYNPTSARGMIEKIIELEDAARERANEEKRLAAQKKVEEVMVVYTAAWTRIREKTKACGYLSHDLFMFVRSGKCAPRPDRLIGRYSRPSALIKKAQEYTTWANEIIATHNF